MIKKYFLVLVISLLLGGCSLGQTQKSAIEEMTGTVKTKVGDEYVFMTNGELKNITSNKVNLDQYVGKEIKVKGMYSGSTLYVDEIGN
jgi:PBP1b-binding outer membrane lipoprotein LpoB